MAGAVVGQNLFDPAHAEFAGPGAIVTPTLVGQARALWPNLDPQTAAREPIANVPTDSQGGHVLGRWTRTRTGGATVQVQSFVDIAGRQQPVGDYRRRAFDLDTQYHTTVGARQDLVAGGSYRVIDERLDGHVGLSLTPAQSNSALFTGFVQDEIGFLANRLAVTLGSQVQYDSVASAGIQPTARVMWKGLPRQRVWAATSRALRTPSLNERGIRLNYPPVPSGNELQATTRGLEVAGQWASTRCASTAVTRRSMSLRTYRPRVRTRSPRQQTGARRARNGSCARRFSPVVRATLHAAMFHVGPLEQLQVSAYTRADVSAEWRFTNGVSVMASGQNLFDAAHAEFAGTQSLLLPTQVPRNASLRLRWTF